jgi:general secretion pathway protein A
VKMQSRFTDIDPTPSEFVRDTASVRDMYEPYFGLSREPFSVAPDPHFLYLSKKHREALSHLIYGLRRGSGFVLLTGEIGAGKTTVWRCFLEQLPSHFEVAYVVNPKLGVNALLTRVCEDLQIELSEDLIDAIHGHLLLASARGKRTLIVVDEAQALSMDVMEQLRLLTNLDTSGTKLQVLLIGQPELRTMLERPALEPLAQRVVARFHLPALAASETTQYIAHRLSVAGLTGAVPFDDAALRLIHKTCGGVPRRINVLCDRALVGAHASGTHVVDRSIVQRAAAEMFGRDAPVAPRRWPALPAVPTWLVATGVVAGALAAGVALAPIIVPALAPAPLGASLLPPPAVPASAVDAAPRTAALPDRAAPEPVRAKLAAAPVPAPMPAPGAAPAAAVAPSPSPATAAPPAAAAATLVAEPVAAVARMVAPVVEPPSAAARLPAVAPDIVAAPADSGLAAEWAVAPADEAPAWRQLAGLWGASLGAGDPCSTAPQQLLRCYRTRGGLGPIRQLGRPGILKLVDAGGRTTHVLLVGLTDDRATLRFGNLEQTVPLTRLARVWRGDFATFWRTPPGYRDGERIGSERMVPWLEQRLALIDPSAPPPLGESALKNRVFAFQLAHGLEPDGQAGPLTMMTINRASGVDEPRLQAKR